MVVLSWETVLDRLRGLSAGFPDGGIKVFGVPKGGMILTAFLQNATATHDPEEADLILDDIVDSGRTRDIYRARFPHTPFHALVDKEKEGILGWVRFPWEVDHPSEGRGDSVEQNIVRILQYLHEDPSREGLRDTPSRVVRSYSEIFSGYKTDPSSILTTFDRDGYDQIILLRGIEIYSVCEHHMLPFVGRAHVGYLPGERIVGISKLARLVDVYARRLQIQERIGEQVTTALMEHLQARGAACVIEAAHLCMQMRGVSKQHSTMVTSSLKGVFLEQLAAREELFRMIGRGS